MKSTAGEKPESPVIFHHSDPVNAGETVSVSGYAFEDQQCRVEIYREQSCNSQNINDAQKVDCKNIVLSDPKWQNVSAVQKSNNSIKFIIPSEWQQGMFACRITTSGGTSNIRGIPLAGVPPRYSGFSVHANLERF